MNKDQWNKGYADALEALKQEIERRKNNGTYNPQNGKNGSGSAKKSAGQGGDKNDKQGQGQGGQQGGPQKKQVPEQGGDQGEGGGSQGGQGGSQGGKGGQQGQGQGGQQGGKGQGGKGGQQSGKGQGQGQGGQQGGQGGDKDDAVVGKDHKTTAKEAVDQVAGSESGKNGNSGGSGQGGHGQSKTGEGIHDFDSWDEEAYKRAKSIVKEYQNKLTGPIGKFVEKCRRAKKTKSGAQIRVEKGGSSWDKELINKVNAYVKQRVFKQKQLTKPTYQKLNRRSGIVKFGQPITPGKRILDDKIVIKICFYIDYSGSMGGQKIENVVNNANYIADAIEKKYKREEVVAGTFFEFWCFDTSFQKIKRHTKVTPNGGTMDLLPLLNGIKQRSGDAMINVVLTDCQFDIDQNGVNKFLKEIKEQFIFVTCEDSPEMKKVCDNNKDKATYIFAEKEFEIS